MQNTNNDKGDEKVKESIEVVETKNEDDNKEINKIFTIDSLERPTRNNLSPDSAVSDADTKSDVVLRTHSRNEIKRVVSTIGTPSVFLSPRRVPSNLDLSNSRPKSELKKNDSMVLKLVLPASTSNPNFENNNFYSSNTFDQIMGNGSLKERHKHQTYSIHSHQEYPMYINGGGHINHGYSPSEPAEGVLTIPTTPAAISYHTDNPTPPEEKKRAFSGILVNSFSIFYALFNVTVGLAVYVADIIQEDFPTAEIFSLVLVGIACFYLIYLLIDISIYTNKKRSYEKLIEKNLPDNIDITQAPDGHFTFNLSLPEITKMGKAIRHEYCFNKDRHSTNFYLKIGAAAFCFGHLVHSGMILGYQLVFFTNDNNRFYECVSIPTLLLDFIYPFYSFLLLFFIFKYSNVIINKNVGLARFGMMHCLSSSLCFWVWTIMREVLEAIQAKKQDEAAKNSTVVEFDPYDLHLYNEATEEFNSTEPVSLIFRRFTRVCHYNDTHLVTIYRTISPYLYPFSVEYCILVVGVLFLVWENINKCDAEDENEATTQCRIPPTGNPDKDHESNVVIHVDCQASNKGLFGGFILLIFTIVSCLLFFIAVYIDNGSKQMIGLEINMWTSLVVLISTFVVCIFGYRQITKLDLNSAHHNLLDDILLFVCIPAFFLNGVFSIIPAITNNNVLRIIEIILEVLQVLLQTAFLMDGLRRSSNTKKLRKSKPGRELVTFLIIANIAMWLMATFEVKAHGLTDDRYNFYGKELWTILGHMCLPLMMFYRFHSSVCFCDIWKFAYEPSGH